MMRGALFIWDALGVAQSGRCIPPYSLILIILKQFVNPVQGSTRRYHMRVFVVSWKRSWQCRPKFIVRTCQKITWSKLRSDLGQIWPCRLSKTAGVAGLRWGFCDWEAVEDGPKMRCKMFMLFPDSPLILPQKQEGEIALPSGTVIHGDTNATPPETDKDFWKGSVFKEK